MLERWSRLGSLTGVAFAVLGVAAFASAQSPPGAEAGGRRVIAFYLDHSTGQKVSDVLWALAFAFFVLFSGSLRGHLRQAPGAEALSALVVAGAAILCAGATAFFGFDYVLASLPASVAPAAAQALNLLALKLVLPVAAGGLVFGLAAGLAILRANVLPAWLGALAIAIGVAFATPALVAGFVALFLWTALTSVLMFRTRPEQRASGQHAVPGRADHLARDEA